jgi:protein FAM50
LDAFKNYLDAARGSWKRAGPRKTEFPSTPASKLIAKHATMNSDHDKERVRRQEQEREDARRQFEEARRAGARPAGIRQFGSSAAAVEAVEQAFKAETVGLVTRAEFVSKRDTIAERLGVEDKRRRDDAEEAAWAERERARAKRAKAERRSKLSFGDEEDEEEDDEEGAAAAEDAAAEPKPDAVVGAAGGAADAAATAPPPPRRFAGVGKDPTAAAAFLPDRDRECAEEALRAQLRAEYAAAQAAARAEPLEITYSYWNGAGHRRTLTVARGDTVAAFLKAAAAQLAPHFRELRAAGASSLMYVKEDVILPGNVAFHDLIEARAQGRSGPLFQFGVRAAAGAVADPRAAPQDAHAGKVMERHWYARHKHQFPFSRYAPLDLEGAHAAPGGAGGGAGGA